MWELWRVHDVFEAGTQLDANGRPAPGSRALPDGEIAAGTPIPSLIPIPTRAMAPMPTPNFQGYPFFIPGLASHRPPHPPLDTCGQRRTAPSRYHFGDIHGGAQPLGFFKGTADGHRASDS